MQASSSFAPKFEEPVVELPDAGGRSFHTLLITRFEDLDSCEQFELFFDSPGQPLPSQSVEVFLNTITIRIPCVVESHGLQVVHYRHDLSYRITSIPPASRRFDGILSIPYRAKLIAHGEVTILRATEKPRIAHVVTNALPAVGVEGSDTNMVTDRAELGIGRQSLRELRRSDLRKRDDEKARLATGTPGNLTTSMEERDCLATAGRSKQADILLGRLTERPLGLIKLGHGPTLAHS